MVGAPRSQRFHFRERRSRTAHTAGSLSSPYSAISRIPLRQSFVRATGCRSGFSCSLRDRVLWPSERRVLVQRYSDAPSRAGRSDTARLHRVEDRNVGRSPRISRSVGSVGAQQNRRDQRHGGGSVSAIRTYRQGLCVFIEVTPQQTEELGFPQSGSDRQSDRVVSLTCSRNALLEESRKSRRDSLRAISNALTPTNTLSRRQR
jgi:hypothetical protein